MSVLKWKNSATGTWDVVGGLVTSMNDLNDVDTVTDPPAAGEALVWDASALAWVPGSAGVRPSIHCRRNCAWPSSIRRARPSSGRIRKL